MKISYIQWLTLIIKTLTLQTQNPNAFGEISITESILIYLKCIEVLSQRIISSEKTVIMN